MPVAEKTPPTEVTIRVSRSILSDIEARYGRKNVHRVEPDDEESINVRDSSWYVRVSAGHTPGRALRVYRENRGLSQAELAKKLGKTRRKQYVADMEAGRRGISKAMAKKLAEVLNAPVERFL
jgi:DNA-binding XRE family transcriptional regulator